METEADDEASLPKLTIPKSIPPPEEARDGAVLENAVPKLVFTLARVSVTRLTYEKNEERWLKSRRRAGGVAVPIEFVDLDFLFRKQCEAVDDGPLLAAHGTQRVLEADPKLYSPSRGRGRLIEANVVFPELIDLEAMLPGEPGSRGRSVATLMKRARIALGTRNQHGIAIEIGLGCHHSPHVGPETSFDREKGTGPRSSGERKTLLSRDHGVKLVASNAVRPVPQRRNELQH
jgi:hypothetical protein